MPNTATVRFASAILLSTTLVAAGCHKGPQDGVVATVNGKAIQRAEVDKVYNAQLTNPNNPQQQTPSQDQADSLRLNILHELITEETVEQRAAKSNLTATNEEVDAKLAEMKAPYTEEQFQERLKASDHTIDDVKHDLRRSLTIDKLLNKEINSKITVTDADVTNYYNAHKAEFNLIENQYHLAQIQVTGVPATQAGNLQGSKASTPEEALQKIKALKNRLDSGEDFGTIAMNFSERTDTAPNGGDMGFVPESQMKVDPSTYAAIMKLAPGKMTEIIPLLDNTTRKPVGYSIYKLISRESAGQREINDPRVQSAIRQQLRDGRSQLLKNAFFEMLRDQAKVENFFAEQVFKNAAK
jgi:peptidyl-prolyl cis-trans isomerase SurA